MTEKHKRQKPAKCFSVLSVALLCETLC